MHARPRVRLRCGQLHQVPVDMGFKSPYSGTYYVACDSTACCKDETTQAAVR